MRDAYAENKYSSNKSMTVYKTAKWFFIRQNVRFPWIPFFILQPNITSFRFTFRHIQVTDKYGTFIILFWSNEAKSRVLKKGEK